MPADGKSTAFIVAKVTDEKGKPLAGKEVLFSANGGQVLVRKAVTDGQGLAISRLCSERLPKGKKKIVRIKAKTNPEGETSVLMDGNLSSTFTLDVSVSLKVWWQPEPSSSWLGVSSGEVAGAAAITFEAQPQYPYIIWCNYIVYEEQGNHPRRLKNGTDEPIYDNVSNRWTWVPFDVGWSILHRSPIKVLASYTVAQDCPADPEMGWECPPPVTETKEITVTVSNAVVKVLEPDPPLLIWDPEDPSKNRLTVTFSVNTAQSWDGEVELRVYRLDRASFEEPIRVIREVKSVPGTHSISWDGMIEVSEDEGMMGLEMAERGIYAFDLWVNLPQTPKPLGDSDTRCSNLMTILPWKDEQGKEVHEAEYYGYDDKGTEEESDDEHIFLVRYGLKCASAMLDDDGDWVMNAFVDEDGDGKLDEDWMDGIDNDNDGRTDEDPIGYCDEDPKDGVDNDKDGLVDEDPQNPVDASAGEILVYDPDLEPLRDEDGQIRRIDIRSLPCVVHDETDGLHASLDGMYHGVLVRVPVSFMQKAGSYHFVIRAWDNHAHLHKDHQVKPALETNTRALVWKGKVKEIGFYLWDYVCQKEWNGFPYNSKLRWDWESILAMFGRWGSDAATNPLEHEFAILRQQPPGNTLYLMAHVEADTPPPPDAKITIWLRTMQSQGDIRVWLPYSAPCPYRSNQYHFRKPYGQEISFHDQLNVNDRYIRVSQKDEEVNELTTYDHARDKNTSNYDDSQELENKLVTHELRGRARFDVGEWKDLEPTLPTLLRFIQAAGVEKIVAEAIPQLPHITVECGREWLPVKNQADILYYSGHGHSNSGSLERWGPNGSASTFTVSDVNPAANWNEDLDYFIIGGCGVLYPDNANGFAWGNVTLKTNLLKGLAGYAIIYRWGVAPFSAPADNTGESTQKVQSFVFFLLHQQPVNRTGDRVLDAWLAANIHHKKPRPAIVYTQNRYWQVNVKSDWRGRIHLGNPPVIDQSW